MFDLATKFSDNRIRVVHTSVPKAATYVLQRCPKAGVCLFSLGCQRRGLDLPVDECSMLATELSDNRIRVVHTSAPKATACVL